MNKKGFTILEITLTLAISTLLFMSVVFGLGRRVANSRYETAVRELSDRLSDVYSEVANTENPRETTAADREFCTLASAVAGTTSLAVTGTTSLAINANGQSSPGRTNCAIYGKIVIFGGRDENQEEQIYIADLVGDVVEYAEQVEAGGVGYGTDEAGDTHHGISLSQIKTLSPIDALSAVHADYLAPTGSSEDGLCAVGPAGNLTAYTPNWGTKLENRNGTPFIGFVIIARSPVTGVIGTYVYHQNDESKTPNITALISGQIKVSCTPTADYYNSILATNHFWANETYDTRLEKTTGCSENCGFEGTSTTELGFCVRSDDFYVSTKSRYLSFLGTGSNANALKVYDADSEETAKHCGKESS